MGPGKCGQCCKLEAETIAFEFLLIIPENSIDYIPSRKGAFMVEPHQAAPEERRGNRRVTVRTEVIRDGKPSVSFGRGENISEGGMKLESSQTFPPDEVVKVRFVLPHPQGAVITSEAKVVWVKPGASVGLQFLDLKDEFREAIARFIEGT